MASARWLIVLIAICSWIAISNHGAVMTKAETTESECPFHSEPASEKETPANVECCKILRAVVASLTKSWARDDANFSDVDLIVALPIVLAESHNVAPLLLDTGPPGTTSFAELIGSVRAHAPPIIA